MLDMMEGHNSANARCRGLHATLEAYRVFYQEFIKVIATTWPDQMPDQFPWS